MDWEDCVVEGCWKWLNWSDLRVRFVKRDLVIRLFGGVVEGCGLLIVGLRCFCVVCWWFYWFLGEF